MAKQGTTRHASNIQEKRIKKTMGGTRTPNSGATPFIKGDNLLEDFLLDGKTSMDVVKSKAVKKDELDKIRQEAWFMRKAFAAMVLSFGDGKDYAVIDLNELKALYDGYKQAEAVTNYFFGNLEPHILDSDQIKDIKRLLSDCDGGL